MATTGVDHDPTMLAAARSRAAKAGLQATFLEGQVERRSFPDATFDVVVSVTVLCFVPDALLARLRNLGYIEGRMVAFDVRFGDGQMVRHAINQPC